MSFCKGAEALIIEHSDVFALRRFLTQLITTDQWPSYLTTSHPNPLSSEVTIKAALFDYFKRDKGEGRIAEFLISCTELEMPSYIKETIQNIKLQVMQPVVGDSDSNQEISTT